MQKTGQTLAKIWKEWSVDPWINWSLMQLIQLVSVFKYKPDILLSTWACVEKCIEIAFTAFHAVMIFYGSWQHIHVSEIRKELYCNMFQLKEVTKSPFEYHFSRSISKYAGYFALKQMS